MEEARRGRPASAGPSVGGLELSASGISAAAALSSRAVGRKYAATAMTSKWATSKAPTPTKQFVRARLHSL